MVGPMTWRSSTIIEKPAVAARRWPSLSGDFRKAFLFAEPLHPGEVLREDYLVPIGLSAGQLAKALGVPRTRIERIVKEEVGITTDTALRLSRYFDTTPNFWMNLQLAYDLTVDAEQLKDELAHIEPRQRVVA